MAIWQFKCWLIPREPLLSRSPAEMPENLAGYEGWWAGHQPPEGYEAVIDSFAPRYKSWSDTILMWGQESGDRVHVFLEGERVEWIPCRLDLRRFSPEFARGVLRLGEFCGSVLWANSVRIFEPEWGALVEAIRASDSWKFVSDPHGFLAGLPRTRRPE